jgi:hypothetical protein
MFLGSIGLGRRIGLFGRISWRSLGFRSRYCRGSPAWRRSLLGFPNLLENLPAMNGNFRGGLNA